MRTRAEMALAIWRAMNRLELSPRETAERTGLELREVHILCKALEFGIPRDRLEKALELLNEEQGRAGGAGSGNRAADSLGDMGSPAATSTDQSYNGECPR